MYSLNSSPTALTVSLACLCLASSLIGCGSGGTPVDPPSPTGTATPGNTSGNWQGQLTAAANTKSLGTFSGSIDQSGGQTSSGQFTTAVFRLHSSCFVSAPAVPSQGFVNGAAFVLNSFGVESQYLDLTGTTTNAGGSIAGNYNIYGGCADGSQGSFTMVRYSPFTGSYVGSAGWTITSTQASSADGSGAFPLSVTGTFPGFTCFTQGTAMPSDMPSISGANIDILFTTDDRSGGQLHMTGSISPDASQVLSYSYSVLGGNCSGQTGSGSLNRK